MGKNRKDHSQNQIICADKTVPIDAKASKKCPIFCEPSATGKGVAIKVYAGLIKEKEGSDDIYAQGICELTGTENNELAEDIIRKASAICGYEKLSDKKNVMLQALAEQQPKDAHEARLCAQATVLYSQGMDYLERARSVLFDDGTIAKQDWHTILMKTATKLLDLHTKTVAELSRYKQNGEQRIFVQHFYVNDGGQAIVGNIIPGGGGRKRKNDEVPHGHSTNL